MNQWFKQGRSVCRPLSQDELQKMDDNLTQEIDAARARLADLINRQKELRLASAGVKVGDAIATRFGILTVQRVDTDYAPSIGHKPAVVVTFSDGADTTLKPNEWSMIGDQ